MIDKERIRQKLANIANRGGATAYWSPPKEGKATIRMIPYPHGKDPFLDYFFHFGIGRQSILCPVKNGMGSSCPICKLAEDLYRSSDPQDKEISKKLYARQRFYGLVVDRADETLTAKYWGFSQTIYIKLAGWLAEDNGDYENFMDFENGLDLVVSLQKTPGKQFQSAEVEPKRRESPLASSKEEVDAILKSVKPATEIFTCMSADEIQSKLNDWLNAEGAPAEEEPPHSAESVEEGTVRGGKQQQQQKAKRQPSRNVDELFDEMADQL
jgi:hypothetical protein